MAVVDNLEIQIKSEASNAIKELDKLIGRIGEFSNAIKSINVGNISSQVSKLTTSFKDINSNGFSEVSRAAKEAHQSVTKLNGAIPKNIKSKVFIDTSDWTGTIDKLRDSFGNIGGNLKFSGNLKEIENEIKATLTSIYAAEKKEAEITSAKKLNVGELIDVEKTIARLQNKFGALTELRDKTKELHQNLSKLQVPEIRENNLEKLQNQLEKAKQKMAFLKTELQNKLTMGKITASIDDSGYVHMREQIALTGKTISALQDRIKVFSDASEKVNSLGNRIEELKSHINNLQSQGFKAGDVEFDKAAAALQRAEQELKQYKAILAQPSKGLQEDIQKTNSLGNHVEELKKKLDELKSRGLNFGDKEFDKAYSELQKVESELLKYKLSLDSTQKSSISFSDKTSQAFKKVGSVLKNMVSGAVSALGRLGSALALNRKNLSNLTSGMSSFRGTTSKTVSSVGSLTKQVAAASGVYLGLYGAIKGIKSSIDFASSLTEVQNVINVTFGKSAKVIEDFAKTSIRQFGLSELSAKQTAGRYQAMGTALGVPQKEMAKMSVELTKLSADMASFYDVAQEDVAKSLQSVFTGTTTPMRRYGVDLTIATLEEWAHKRGIDAKIKSMSQAEKMMLRYQYVMERTGAAQGDFQRTIHTWHNQITLLKENFRELSGVIGTAFINTLKPVIETLNAVMGKVIAFSKTVLNSLGQIFGWEYEDTGGGVANDFMDEMEGAGDLADGMDDVADATDEATKKQKEFNKQLAKFDELTNYTTSEKGGGKDKDNGKDSTGLDDLAGLGGEYGGGEWKKKDSIFKKFKSELDTLYKLGEYIGNTLTEVMEGINWDSIYEKARNFGSGLASFLNGLISPGLFSALGKTVAGSINTAINAALGFGENFNFDNFGTSIASFINSALGGIDWGTALTAATTWGVGIATAINSFIKETDFELVGSSVASFVNTAIQGALSLVENLNFEGIGQSIATALNSFIHETDFESIGTLIANFVNGAARSSLSFAENFNFEGIGEKIAGFINSALGGIEWKTILTAASVWGEGIAQTINSFFKQTDFDLIGSTVGNFINTAINFVLSSGEELDFQDVGQKIADGINEAFKTIDFEDLAESINTWIKGALTTVTTLLKKTDFEEIGKKIGTFLAELDFGEILGDIAESIWEAIKAAFGLLSGLFEEAPLETALITVFAVLKFTGLGKFIAGNIAASISSSLTVALSGLSLPSLPVLAAIAGVGAALVDLWNTSETFRDAVKNAFDRVKESLKGAFDKIKNAILPLIEAVGNLGSSLYDFYSGSPIKAIVDLFASLATSLIGSAISTVIDTLGTTIEGLAEILTGAFDILSGFFDILTGIFTLDFDKVIDGFKSLGKGITKAFSGIIDLTIGIGKDIIDGFLEGIANGVKAIGKWIKNTIVDPIVNNFKKLFGIHSPSTVMAELGKFIAEGLIDGISNMLDSVIGTFADIRDNIVDTWDKIKEKTSEVWNNISSSVSETWSNLKTWASEKFETVRGAVADAWDEAKQKTSDTWDTVSSSLKTTWNNLKSWASDKFGNVKKSVIGAWDEAKKKTLDTWKEVSNTLSSKWNDFKNWASDKFGKVKDSVKVAWDNIKSKTSETWSDNGKDSVTKMLSSAWSNLKTWASEKFENIKNNVKTAWNNIKTNTSDVWSGKKSITDVLTNSWETIKNSVKNALTGKDGIVSKLSSAWDSIKKTAEAAWKKIGNSILSPIETAVNGVIKGINWVLDKVGSKTQFNLWNAPKFASGTDGLPQDTIGIVNDQPGNIYRELIVPPHGKPFIPKGRNVTLPMEKGTKIMPAKQTKEFMQGMKGMPHFAGGIGKFFGDAWEKLKDFTGNIWDYISNPKKILQIAIDKFSDFADIAEPAFSIIKGSVSTLMDGAVDYVKKLFDSAGGGAGIERAISWALKIASDDSHGYDQNSRWGTPDYDCSSFVISAFEQAGIKLKSAGATYTGDMRGAALKTGFSDVTKSVNLSSGGGLKRGDILLDAGRHVALYLGDGQLVHASINENGGITGGQPGDQTGREITTRGYYNHPWSSILRYTGKSDNKFANGIGKINLSDMIKGFAKGGISKNELGVVNDQSGNTYKELIIPPHGKPFIPEGRNVTLAMEKGTRIIPADKTKKFLNKLPHFANGTEVNLSSDNSKNTNKTGLGIAGGVSQAINDTLIPYIREMIRILQDNASNGGSSKKKTTTKYADTVKEIQAAWTGLAKWFESTVVEPITKGFNTMKEELARVFDNTNEELTQKYTKISTEWQDVLTEIPGWIKENVNDAITSNFTDFCSKIAEGIKTTWGNIQDVLSPMPGWIESDVTNPIKDSFTGIFSDVKTSHTTMWDMMSTYASGKVDWITTITEAAFTRFSYLISEFENKLDALDRDISATESTISSTADKISETKKQLEDVQALADDIKINTGSTEKSSLSKLSEAQFQNMNLTGSFKEIPKKAAQIVQGATETTLSRLEDVIKKTGFGIKRYAAGGFPEDGWFRASHGEIMGQFDNGQSVVANNQQITSGIANAVYPAVYNAMMAAMASSGGNGGDIVVQIDGENVFRVVRDKDNDFYKRNHRGAFEH